MYGNGHNQPVGWEKHDFLMNMATVLAMGKRGQGKHDSLTRYELFCSGAVSWESEKTKCLLVGKSGVGSSVCGEEPTKALVVEDENLVVNAVVGGGGATQQVVGDDLREAQAAGFRVLGHHALIHAGGDLFAGEPVVVARERGRGTTTDQHQAHCAYRGEPRHHLTHVISTFRTVTVSGQRPPVNSCTPRVVSRLL